MTRIELENLYTHPVIQEIGITEKCKTCRIEELCKFAGEHNKSCGYYDRVNWQPKPTIQVRQSGGDIKTRV